MENQSLFVAVHLSQKLWGLHTKYEHFSQSILSQHLFHSIAVSGMGGSVVTIKEITAEFGAAPSVVRRLVRDLEDKGLIVSVVHADDARVRALMPTPRLLDMLNVYAHDCHDCISGHVAVNGHVYQ